MKTTTKRFVRVTKPHSSKLNTVFQQQLDVIQSMTTSAVFKALSLSVLTEEDMRLQEHVHVLVPPELGDATVGPRHPVF